MNQAVVNCLMLLMQPMPCAFAFDLLKAGNNKAARMAMMAMTTSNSISVNPNLFMPGSSMSLDRTGLARQTPIVLLSPGVFAGRTHEPRSNVAGPEHRAVDKVAQASSPAS